MSRCGGGRSPFGPIRVPADVFEDIEPIPDPDGGPPLKRVRIKGMGENSPIGVEVRARLIHNEITEIKPMKMPVGSIFYLDYQYGKKEDG